MIVSNNASNRILNRLQAVPLTSNVDRLYSAEAYVRLNGEPRKAMANQLTTISKLRLRGMIGKLDASDMLAVDRAIRVQLAL